MDNTLSLHLKSHQPHQLNFADEDRQAAGLRDQKDDEIIYHSTPGMSFTCQADRQKIIEQAKLVLAEARVVAEQSNRTLALPVSFNHAAPPGSAG